MAALPFRPHRWAVGSVLLLLVLSVSDFWTCFGPPWLEHGVIATLTAILSLAVYLIGWRRFHSRPHFTSLPASWWAGGLSAILFVVYLWLFIEYTVPLPDHCHREVVGWDLTPAAKAYLSRELGTSVQELLEDAGRQVEVVYLGGPLRTMRFVLTGTWLLAFGLLALFLALLTARAEVRPFRKPPAGADVDLPPDSIFISYRRFDSQDVTGRIYDSLTTRFPKESVFKDVHSIPLGVPFPEYFQGRLRRARAVLVVIGPTWLTVVDANGRRRLDDPNDFVRVEVETALRSGVLTIPVTVSNAPTPGPGELPEALRELAFRNGLAVRPDPDYHRDMDRLISRLTAVLGLSRDDHGEERSSSHFPR
jgi:hypothetical protein